MFKIESQAQVKFNGKKFVPDNSAEWKPHSDKIHTDIELAKLTLSELRKFVCGWKFRLVSINESVIA